MATTGTGSTTTRQAKKTSSRPAKKPAARKQAESHASDIPFDVPEGLDREDHEAAEEHKHLRAPVVYEIIRRQGVQELKRPIRSLWWSGVAAGIAISTSVFAQGFLHMYLPDETWQPLVQDFGYCLGFIIVILGGFQLFTETTITAILPLLAHRTRDNLVCTARMWGVVFAANMAGTFAAAVLATIVGIASKEQLAAFLEISRHFTQETPLNVALNAMPAGFFIAALVWMLPRSKGTEFWVIVAVTYIIALGGFAHVVAGSTEVFLLVVAGEIGFGYGVFGLIAPAFIGNVLGGTVLFSLIAYAQVSEEL